MVVLREEEKLPLMYRSRVLKNSLVSLKRLVCLAPSSFGASVLGGWGCDLGLHGVTWGYMGFMRCEVCVCVCVCSDVQQRDVDASANAR